MKILLSVICMLSILNLSCSYLKRNVSMPAKGGVEEGKQNEDAMTKKRLRMLVLKGNYTEVLETIRDAVASGSPEVSYGEECVLSINGLSEEGVIDFSKENYVSAGMIFRTIIDNYPADKNLQAKINHPLEETKSYLDTCSEKLMEKGLFEYRRGELEKAISIWEEILKFNPEYMDVKQMIKTATVQAENLETIK